MMTSANDIEKVQVRVVILGGSSPMRPKSVVAIFGQIYIVNR